MKIYLQTADSPGGGGQVAGVIVTPGQQSGAAPTAEPEAPPAEGMRRLEKAAGGDEVPQGPLGGPEFKTREELVIEENTAIKEQAETEIAIAEEQMGEDTASGGDGDGDGDTTGGGGDTTVGGDPLA